MKSIISGDTNYSLKACKYRGRHCADVLRVDGVKGVAAACLERAKWTRSVTELRLQTRTKASRPKRSRYISKMCDQHN